MMLIARTLTNKLVSVPPLESVRTRGVVYYVLRTQHDPEAYTAPTGQRTLGPGHPRVP